MAHLTLERCGLQLPTFIGIGGMRCGTTWLHSVLARHPDVFVTKAKELHYFNRRILKYDLYWYSQHFRAASEQIRGEITPAYSTLKQSVVDNIAASMPWLKLLLVMRNPIDRAWSHFIFEACDRDPGNVRIERVSVGRCLRHLERARNQRRTDYERMIRIWQAAFGKHSLEILLYDELKQNPSAFLSSALRHIGADDQWRPSEGLESRVHSNQSIPPPDIVRWYLAVQWLDRVRRLNNLLDGRVEHWVEELSQIANESSPSRRAIRAANRHVLSLPERLAYRAYDVKRDRELDRRCLKVLADAAECEAMD